MAVRLIAAAVGSHEVQHWTNRNDAGGVDVVVCDVIVALDMVNVHRLGDAVDLIEIFKVAEQVGIIDNAPDIALKMTLIDRVEPDERDKQTPVGFDESLAE